MTFANILEKYGKESPTDHSVESGETFRRISPAEFVRAYRESLGCPDLGGLTFQFCSDDALRIYSIARDAIGRWHPDYVSGFYWAFRGVFPATGTQAERLGWRDGSACHAALAREVGRWVDPASPARGTG